MEYGKNMIEVVNAYKALRATVENRVNEEVKAGRINPESANGLVTSLMNELVSESCKVK